MVSHFKWQLTNYFSSFCFTEPNNLLLRLLAVVQQTVNVTLCVII